MTFIARLLRNPIFAIILLIFAMACYGYFAILTPWHFRHDNDFKHIYLGMQALYDESEPYSLVSLRLQASLHGLRGASLNPYVYLPFTGLVLGFMKGLSFPAASALWFLLNQVFVLLATLLMAREFWRKTAVSAWAVLLLCLSFNTPLIRTLTAGQLNCAILLLLTSVYCLLRRNRDGWGGTILGFATVFKLFPGLLTFHLIAFRKWNALFAMIAACCLLILTSIAAVGLKVHLAFLPMLRQMGYGRSTWAEFGQTYWKDPANQGLNSFFSHIMVKSDGTTPWITSTQSTANLFTTATVALLVILWIWSHCRSARCQAAPTFSLATTSQEASFQATTILALLIPSLMWDHYLLIAFLPVAWLWKQSLANRMCGRFALAIMAQILISIPWRFDSPLFTHGALLPLMSMKLFPTLLIYGLTLCFVSSNDQRVLPVITNTNNFSATGEKKIMGQS